ncbi:MAG: Holliday junction resolvase RuvX [Patescibacteria group bacterium]
MKLLGIDYGTERIGVALGDTDVRVAVPFEAIDATALAAERIVAIGKQENIEIVVMGLPKNLQGQEGKSASRARRLAEKIQSLGMKIVFEDERFSTKEVERAMKEYGKAKRGIDKDAAAAAIILQTYIEKTSDK